MTRDKLVQLIREKKSYLCVGLDSDLEKIPQWIKDQFDDPIFEFNKAIIDATLQYAVAYKPNLAFYECHGAKGWHSLEKTINYINQQGGDKVFTIADAKRGDIGNTARLYAETFFNKLQFDAVTVNPFMGRDSVEPFTDIEGKWTIVLGLTSNPGARDFQISDNDNGAEITHPFETMMHKCTKWGTPENLMFVVGATRGELIKKARAAAPNHFFLVPGVGTQGGSLKDVSEIAMTKDCGLLVNVSRQIIFASQGTDFQQRAASVAADYQMQMEVLLRAKGEGR
jgi:orotidine-5'-phosphate decarboxylase